MAMARPMLARAAHGKLTILDADATDGTDSSGDSEEEEYVAPKRGGRAAKKAPAK